MNIDIKELIAAAMEARAAVHIRDGIISITPWEDEAPKEKPEEKKPDARKQNNVKKIDMGKLMALRKAGWSYEKIADEMGISPQTVANRLKADAVAKEGT